jgi:hypothetical protein
MGLVVAKLPKEVSDSCWSAPSYFALEKSESIKLSPGVVQIVQSLDQSAVSTGAADGHCELL